MSLSRCAKLSASTMEKVASGTAPIRPDVSGSADFCIVFPGDLPASDTPARAGPTRTAAPAYGREGEPLQWGQLAKLGFYQTTIPRLVGPFDSGNIRCAAVAPAEIGIAGLEPHGLGDEVDPVPDADTVLAVERDKLAVA